MEQLLFRNFRLYGALKQAFAPCNQLVFTSFYSFNHRIVLTAARLKSLLNAPNFIFIVHEVPL